MTMLFDYTFAFIFLIACSAAALGMIFNVRFRFIALGSLALLLFLILTEPSGIIPVLKATKKDWHPETFWYEPWGGSVVHRGTDIFAEKGQPVIASVGCLTLIAREIKVGGKVVLCLDRSLRLHYYAHLDSYNVEPFDWNGKGEQIGTVGNSGNAFNKPPHLHYGVMSVIPRPWNITNQTLGWMKAFYLDPNTLWN